MQRWIVIGIIALALAFGGGAFGYWSYRQHRPDKVWVPLPLNPALGEDQRAKAAAELKTKLESDEILTRVCTDLSLADKWKLSSTDAAKAEVKKRLFVEIGEVALNGTTAPSANVGVTGIRKERQLLGEISTHLIKEVWKILGIKPPPGQGI
ncbi:MAG: hypothetical protein QM680_05790 [Luteolibacter sp.]